MEIMMQENVCKTFWNKNKKLLFISFLLGIGEDTVYAKFSLPTTQNIFLYFLTFWINERNEVNKILFKILANYSISS